MEKRKLLVVDDFEMDRTLIQKLMSDEYDVFQAENGIEAWKILGEQPIDAMLLDIVMPEMDGMELLMKLRSHGEYDHIGVLMATSTKEQTEGLALEAGADDIVSKPYNTRVIRTRLANIIAKKNLEKAVEQAREANEAKNTFMSNMSHDMRTPLNAIINLTGLAREERYKPDQLINDLDKIAISGEFLLSLVNDVLDMAKIESGSIELMPGVYPYKEFIDYVDSMIVPLCLKKDIKFHWEKGTYDPDVFIDRTRFNQIFFNLLSNAVKYTPEGGSVSLKVSVPKITDESMYCDIVVEDSGKGMSEEFQKKMFLPFEREDNSEAYTGTGLGLSITKAIVDKMKGSIQVDSKEGAGTAVTVSIPMQLATKAQSETYRKHHMPEHEEVTYRELRKLCKGRRILIVEDHPLNREILSRLLEKMGPIIEIAENGQIALDMIKEHTAAYYSLVFMDIRMPVMNGLEATKAIRSLRDADVKSLPIIAMTANAYTEDVLASVRAGMNDHLSKPVETKKLYETLQKYMEMQQSNIKPKIIVVDDVEVNAVVAAESLREYYDVIITDNGREALKVLEENRDVIGVITDIQMPNMNGIELVRRIRSNKKYDNIAILANTQYGDPAQEEVLLRCGADDFVYKPTTPAVLSTRLENVLLKYRQAL